VPSCPCGATAMFLKFAAAAGGVQVSALPIVSGVHRPIATAMVGVVACCHWVGHPPKRAASACSHCGSLPSSHRRGKNPRVIEQLVTELEGLRLLRFDSRDTTRGTGWTLDVLCAWAHSSTAGRLASRCAGGTQDAHPRGSTPLPRVTWRRCCEADACCINPPICGQRRTMPAGV